MLKGICTPVCTPFTGPSQKFDETVFLAHIDRMLAAGIHIIAVCGGTGEFPFLHHDERLHMAEIAAKRVAGKSKLIVQTSAQNTQEAIEYSKHAQSVGADAIMVLPPYFEGPDADGVEWHYAQIGKAVKTPIMAYNIPVHSGFDITPEIYARFCAAVPNITYIKDSTGDLMRIERLVAQGANVFCGCDYLAPYALMAGATGCFWGGSNVMPKEAVALYTLCADNKLPEANELWKTMKAANIFFWGNAYNPAIKAAVRMMGHDLGECRLPVYPLEAEKLSQLEAALAPLRCLIQ